MTTARELVDAIQSGKSATIQASFNSLMTEKIQNGIEAYRQAVIDNTFNPVDESEEDEAAVDSSLDELSKETLGDYIRKKTLHHLDGKFGAKGETAKDKAKPKGAKSGISRAMKRLYSGNESEELQLEDYSLEEIQEFMESEDFASLDELSKKTLASYTKKASVTAVTGKEAAAAQASEMGRHLDKGDVKGATHFAKKANDLNTKVIKRVTGIAKAADKLAKD